MNKINKKVCIFIVAILLVGLIPIDILAIGKTDSIIYKAQKLEVGLLNIQTMNNDAFKRAYVRTVNDDFNLTSKFLLESSGNIRGGASGVLSYYSSFIHKSNGSGWYANYVWPYRNYDRPNNKYNTNYPTLVSLIQSEQIKSNITADLELDNHKNIPRHMSKKKDKARYALYQTAPHVNYTQSLTAERNADSDPDQSPVQYGYDKWCTLDSGSAYTHFRLKLDNTTCQCGSSKAQRISFSLADYSYPYVSSIYTSSDVNGRNVKNGFIKDEVGYINLRFNEPIRFSNDIVPNYGQYSLIFSLINTDNNQEATGNGVNADFVALQNNVMTFKFITPATIGNSNTNHYIAGISNNQNWTNNIGDRSYDLKLLGANGSQVNLSGILAQDIELTKTSSLISDLAGNPINWGKSVKSLSTSAHLDNVLPYVKTVELAGNMITKDSAKYSQASEWPKDIDRSAVFAGVGDNVTFSVNFSEELNLGLNNINLINATINVNDGVTPIVLTADRIDTVKDGVNGINVSKVTFKEIIITETMVPMGTKSPLAITEISFPNGVTDLRGNVVNNNIVVTSKAKQQEWLDTLAPNVSSGVVADNNDKFAPIYYSLDNKNEFYFPINVVDDNARDIEYASNSNGAIGEFAWVDNSNNLNKISYPFEYYVSATTNKPNTYMQGNTSMSDNSQTTYDFVQVENGNYIHIRLLDNVEYNLNNSKFIIKGTDCAGNINKVDFNLNYIADRVIPKQEEAGYSTSFNSGTKEGSFNVKIKISDTCGVEPSDIFYQWVGKDENFENNNWLSYIGSTIGNIPTDYIISVIKSSLQNEMIHEFNLGIKSIDKSGNESIGRFSYVYDLRKAACIIDIKTDINEPVAHPLISISSPIGNVLIGGAVETPATTLFMMENPDMQNQYFIREISSNSKEFIADILSDDSLYKWYVANVTESGNGFNFANGRKLNYYDVESYERKKFDELCDNYYGLLELIVITSYGELPTPFNLIHQSEITTEKTIEDIESCYDGNSTFLFKINGVNASYHHKRTIVNGILDSGECYYFSGSTTSGAIVYNVDGVTEAYNLLPLSRVEGNISVDRFTVKSSAIPRNLVGKQLHYIDIKSALMPDGTKVTITNANVPEKTPEGIGYVDSEYVPGGEPRFLSSLDGIQIPFTISNSLIHSWGVDDVDFDSSETYMALYYTRDQKYVSSISEEICKMPLNPNSTEQVFVIPDGKATKTGFYSFEVSVKSKNKGSIYNTEIIKKENSRIFLNAESTKDMFGFYGAVGNSYYENDIRRFYLNNFDKIESDYNYINSFNIGTLQSPNTGTDWTFYFGRDRHNRNSDYNNKYYGEYNTGFNKIYIYDHAYFKVWNNADLNGYDNAPWGTVLGNVDVVYVDNANDINTAIYQNSGEYTAPHVPIIRGKENTICYQMILQNGEISSIRQITINTGKIAPTIETTFSPDKPTDGSLVSKVIASVQSIFSPNGVADIGCIEISDRGNIEGYSPRYMEGGLIEFRDNICYLYRNGEYVIYIVDNFGNIGAVKKTVDYIDSEYPTVLVVNNNSAGNEFNVIVTVEDNYDINCGELYLTFDSEYSKVLNSYEQEATEDKGMVTVKIPHNTKGGEWYATSATKDGIYYTNTILSADKKIKTIEIKGIFKFDTTKSEAGDIERTLVFTASDKAGAVSSMYMESYDSLTDTVCRELVPGSFITLLNTKNIAPKYVDSSLTTENKVKLKFNVPILVDKPIDTLINSRYLSEIDTLPIYSDGEYSICYIDLFGKKYDENINLTPYGDFDVSVNISNEEPTNSDVMVSIDASAKTGLTIESIDGIVLENIKIDSTNKTAIATIKQNSNLIVTLKKDNKTVERTIVISNIDKEAPIVEPYIYYAAGKPLANETTTDGEVVAGVICNEDLVGLNGPLTYTFKFGSPASHTFEFVDLAGNKGELKVDLPCTINEPKTVDTTKPIYSMDVYVKTNNAMNQNESFMSWSGDSINSLVNNLPNAQGYLFNFIPQDESQVKLIVKNGVTANVPNYADKSDIIDGVIVGDRSILIEKNISFTVFLIDSSGNYESILFNILKTDNIAPTAEIVYVPSTFYSIRAYLREIGIKDPNGFIVANVLDVLQDKSGGENNGLYYHDFKENSDFIFYFKDGVGNNDQLISSVSGIDNNPASVVQVKWSPVNPSYTGFVTNKDITAQIQFNKTVKGVRLEWANDADKTKNINDYVSLSISSNHSIVTFKQNTPPVKVKFKALNDKDGIYELQSVNCIDKIVPNITVGSIDLSQNKKTASLTFISNKEVSFAEGLSPDVFSKTFTKSVNENGTYIFNFTDKAGNCVKSNVDITTIDNEKLVLSFNIRAIDSGATDKANELNIKIGDSFFVKMNKSGTVIFNGNLYNLSANTWMKIAVAQAVDDLIYVVKATDECGESVYAYLNIAPIDKVPPTVMLKSSIVSVSENTDKVSLETAIKANIIVNDDITSLENIVLAFDIDKVDTLTKGIYSIGYKATDENGNSTEKNGYVRVYGKDEINVLLNGVRTSFGSTTVIDTSSINLDISNINNELYTVYYKSGIKTEGQMKIGSTIVANKTLELTNNGFYTIYIVTQTRRAYIMYIYIEQ